MSPKIVDAAVRVEPGSQVTCSAIGTPPIYIALKRNFAVLMISVSVCTRRIKKVCGVCVCVCVMNTTNTLSSKLYLEGNHTCVATSKYGTDEKHFVIKGGEKIRYFETNTMHTELRLAI